MERGVNVLAFGLPGTGKTHALCALGYQGSYSTVVQYVRPRRRCRQPEATMRFETAPGEQAPVDWGSCPTLGQPGSSAASGCL